MGETTLKALSIRQPWAWAILHGGKRIENRDWKGCAYRGPILIHAGKSVGTRAEFDGAAQDVLNTCVLGGACVLRDEHLDLGADSAGPIWLPRKSLQRGGIVGRARVDAVVKGQRDLWDYIAAANTQEAHDQRRWYTGGFALVLVDVETVPFVPWNGALGLFDVPENYAQRAVAKGGA